MVLIEGEFGLINKYFAPLSKSAPGAANLTDDVAFFEVSAGKVPVVSLDTLVGGVHFFFEDPPRTLAKKTCKGQSFRPGGIGCEAFRLFLIA